MGWDSNFLTAQHKHWPVMTILVQHCYVYFPCTTNLSNSRSVQKLKFCTLYRSLHSAAVLRQVHSLFQSGFSTTCDLSASAFNFQYPLFTVSSSTGWLRLLPCLPVAPILPSLFPSITCFRRQFLRNMWPVHFAFFLLNVGYSRPACLCVMLDFSPDRSIGSSPTFSSTTF